MGVYGKSKFPLNLTNTTCGILFMVLHAFSMAVYYVIIKELSLYINPLQMAFLYKLTLFIAILPWCLWRGSIKNLKTKRFGLHVARGTFSVIGTLCFTVALSHLPAFIIVGISYWEHILVILIGVFYFKEKFESHKIVMVVLSFIGGILIIKPGYITFNTYYVFLFMAVLFWAMNCSVIKILGATEKLKVQLFYATLFSVLFSFPFALYEWKPVELWQIKYLIAIAVCYIIHGVAFFKALKYADMTTVMPFDYTRLFFIAVLGYLVLSELPDRYSILGYIFIVIGGVYAIYREAYKYKGKYKLSQAEKAKLEAEYEQA